MAQHRPHTGTIDPLLAPEYTRVIDRGHNYSSNPPRSGEKGRRWLAAGLIAGIALFALASVESDDINDRKRLSDRTEQEALNGQLTTKPGVLLLKDGVKVRQSPIFLDKGSGNQSDNVAFKVAEDEVLAVTSPVRVIKDGHLWFSFTMPAKDKDGKVETFFVSGSVLGQKRPDGTSYAALLEPQDQAIKRPTYVSFDNSLGFIVTGQNGKVDGALVVGIGQTMASNNAP
jgi:hypothetical protein